MDGVDPLAQYHQSHANRDHISRPDLIQKLAIHALRKIPDAHHVIRKIVTEKMRPVTQLHPPAYNNDGKMQMMHN